MSIRWGILATGRIAHKLAVAIESSASGELVAVASRTLENAVAFASRYNEVTPLASYDELVSSSDVEAIYIATPHPQHAEWTIKSLAANKAVLCEKPMGINHAEVMAMVHAAHCNGTFLMEAFMYRLHPQVAKVLELVEDGAIGELRHIHATFGFHANYDPSSRLFANELAGGGIMDVGCYPISFSRLIARSEPNRVEGHGLLSPEGIDLYAAGMLYFDNGLTAQVATGVGQQLDNVVEVFGTRGSIRIPWPWRSPSEWEIEVTRGGSTERVAGEAADAYVSEVDEVARCIGENLLESPAMTWDDSLGNAQVLDAWKNKVGVKFRDEELANRARPVHGRPLVANEHLMKYGSIPNLQKPVSRLVFGCDNQPSELHAMVMFDHFFESGGNAFDTAFIYGGNRLEQYLGAWVDARDIREDLVIIGKGAHTPHNFPEFVEPQLVRSLDSLKTDYVDIYFLHRDNLDVPVGEWIDVLNQQQSEGRCTLFGGSNWSLGRIQEANEWASKHGKSGLAAVSNQFSLARMLNPVWPGCISSNDSEFRKFLTDSGLALFPWSSQARGFFTNRVDSLVNTGASKGGSRFGTDPSDEELERCWFSKENFERRHRARDLGGRLGVEAINIALAFVLVQPFPCFPLFGPRQLLETSSSLRSVHVDLSDDDIRWLDLRV